MIPKANQQYYLTEVGLMLNHLNPDLQRHLPPTDSRYRYDLRLYEQGKFRGADFEKKRMIKATNQRMKEKKEMARSESFRNSVSVGVQINKSRWFEEETMP